MAAFDPPVTSCVVEALALALALGGAPFGSPADAAMVLSADGARGRAAPYRLVLGASGSRGVSDFGPEGGTCGCVRSKRV